MGTSNLHRIGGIDPKNVVDEYNGWASAKIRDSSTEQGVSA